jgi:hypothetical protein
MLLCFLFIAVICECSSRPEEHIWVSITEHGDKPSIAIILFEKAGKVTAGKFYIFEHGPSPNLYNGIGYRLKNLNHEDKTVKCDVTVIDESSPTGKMDMHMTITLKATFEGDSIPAEVQESANEKQGIVFSKENGIPSGLRTMPQEADK